MANIPDSPITRKEKYLDAIANGTTEVPEPTTREEEYLAAIAANGVKANPTAESTGTLEKLKVGDVVYKIPEGGSGGTSDYNDLNNKPQIGGEELSGNKSLADIGIEANPEETSTDDLEKIKVGSVVYKIHDGGALTKALNVTQNVGGVKSGDSYAIGDSIEDLLHDMLDPVLYPEFTAPSATLAATGAKLVETGATLSTTMTVTFNRGSIDPAYGTSGYRSGEAQDYSLNGGTAQAENTFSVDVDATQKTYQASVSYAAGEQPKDSAGNDYSTPLPAGSVNTNTITYEFVDAMWANTAAIGTIAKLSLVSKSEKQRDMVFPAQTAANPEVFDIPASWTVTAVQVKNDLSGQYEDASAQFTVTDTTHDDAAGNSVAYKRYTFNLGYGTGSRTVRVKWS